MLGDKLNDQAHYVVILRVFSTCTITYKDLCLYARISRIRFTGTTEMIPAATPEEEAARAAAQWLPPEDGPAAPPPRVERGYALPP